MGSHLVAVFFIQVILLHQAIASFTTESNNVRVSEHTPLRDLLRVHSPPRSPPEATHEVIAKTTSSFGAGSKNNIHRSPSEVAPLRFSKEIPGPVDALEECEPQSVEAAKIDPLRRIGSPVAQEKYVPELETILEDKIYDPTSNEAIRRGIPDLIEKEGLDSGKLKTTVEHKERPGSGQLESLDNTEKESLDLARLNNNDHAKDNPSHLDKVTCFRTCRAATDCVHNNFVRGRRTPNGIQSSFAQCPTVNSSKERSRSQSKGFGWLLCLSASRQHAVVKPNLSSARF